MSFIDRFRNAMGGGRTQAEEEVVGTILDRPATRVTTNSPAQTLVFHLDSCPDVEFEQVVSPLAAERRRGERVKVHFNRRGDNKATVTWIERI